MNDLLNWGFQPIGTPLGSESAISMPMGEQTGLEEPMAANAAMLEGFVEQTQRRYGNVSDPGGTIWDPRGDRALSPEVADYRTTDMMRPDEIPVSIADLSPELLGGDPVLAPYAASNQLDPAALMAAGLGLSDAGAATLADSLSVVDPAILDGIYMPPQVEPTFSNDMGLVTKHGGLPEAFFDRGAGVMHQGMPEAVERVLAAQGEYQYVDENGVVDKYPAGTGPYDSPGMTRPGSLLGALPGTAIRTKKGIVFGGDRKRLTPADIAASPRLALGATGIPGTPPGFGSQSAPLSRAQRLLARKIKAATGGTGTALSNSARENLSSGGSGTEFIANANANQPTQQPGSGGLTNGGSTYVTPQETMPGYDADGGVDHAVLAVAGAAPVDCPSWNIKCWWPIALGAGVTALGAYLLLKKKGKK